jgi:hypothetical protein
MRTAAIMGLCTFLCACASPIGNSSAPDASPQPSASAGNAASGPRIEPPTVTPPIPPGTNLPAFACADASGGVKGTANVTGVRVAEQSGYDRFVIQFDTIVPAYTVKRQPKPTFIAGASGQSITLSGTAGALLNVQSASEASTYSGPTDFTHADYQVLNEARLTQDFEGHVSWGLGLSRATCMRTFTLANPARLVIDFTTSAS